MPFYSNNNTNYFSRFLGTISIQTRLEFICRQNAVKHYNIINFRVLSATRFFIQKHGLQDKFSYLIE